MLLCAACVSYSLRNPVRLASEVLPNSPALESSLGYKTIRYCTSWILNLQGVSRFLDRAEAADRAAIKAHAQQAQYDEYDDEYDDSYDDLGGPSADGIADVEGDTALIRCDRLKWQVLKQKSCPWSPCRPLY